MHLCLGTWLSGGYVCVFEWVSEWVNEQTQARTTQLIQANGKQNSHKATQTCTPRSHTLFYVYPLFNSHLSAVWKYLDTLNIFFGNEVFWNNSKKWAEQSKETFFQQLKLHICNWKIMCLLLSFIHFDWFIHSLMIDWLIH